MIPEGNPRRRTLLLARGARRRATVGGLPDVSKGTAVSLFPVCYFFHFLFLFYKTIVYVLFYVLLFKGTAVSLLTIPEIPIESLDE